MPSGIPAKYIGEDKLEGDLAEDNPRCLQLASKVLRSHLGQFLLGLHLSTMEAASGLTEEENGPAESP